MPQRIDPDSIGFVLIDLARLFRAEFERRVAVAGLGLTPGEARVLTNLARCAPIRQHILADRLGVAQMSLTAFIDRLEQAGLVERIPDPDDRRAKQVRLTPAADAVLPHVTAIGAEVREIARGAIPEKDWDRFRALAIEVRGNLAGAAT